MENQATKTIKSSDDTYEVTYPDNGRVWTLRPIPKHVFLQFGVLPASLTETAARAVMEGREADFEEEIVKTMSSADFKKLAKFQDFLQAALSFAVVSPSIVLEPQSEDEISAFEISPEEFAFLQKTILNPRGAEAERLNNFRK